MSVFFLLRMGDGVYVPPPPATTSTGGGRKRRKYPRKAMIRGVLYHVQSLDEEYRLLQALLDRAEYQDAVSTEAVTAEPVKVLKRRIKRVASEREKWLAKLRADDEELLILLLH